MIQVFQIDRERLDQTASSNIWQCAGCCFPFPSLIEQSVADRQSEERWRRLLLGATKKAARKSLPFVLHAILGVALVSLSLLFFCYVPEKREQLIWARWVPSVCVSPLRISPSPISVSRLHDRDVENWVRARIFDWCLSKWWWSIGLVTIQQDNWNNTGTPTEVLLTIIRQRLFERSLSLDGKSATHTHTASGVLTKLSSPPRRLFKAFPNSSSTVPQSRPIKPFSFSLFALCFPRASAAFA